MSGELYSTADVGLCQLALRGDATYAANLDQVRETGLGELAARHVATWIDPLIDLFSIHAKQLTE